MHIGRKITVFCIIALLLLTIKTIVYLWGGELYIVSDSIIQRLTNIAYILRQDTVVFAIGIIGYTRLKKTNHQGARWRYLANIIYYIFYLVDIRIYKIFLSRLAPSQYLTFLSADTVDQFGLYTIIFIFIGAICYIVVRLLYHRSDKSSRRHGVLIGVTITTTTILMLAGFSKAKIELYPYAQNIIRMQTRILRSKTNSSSDKLYTDYSIIRKGQNKKPNIIVLFAESRSAIDSLRAGGLYDRFPKFDKIQQDGVTFTNFFAHGCTSDASHIAFLQGTEPRVSTHPGGAYEKYINYRGYLPKYFQDNGYNTQFFSTVSLDFLEQRKYIQKLGFDMIWGEEYFIDKPKYVFDAAPDSDLYDKTIEQIENATDDPFMFILQNVSGHHPYNTPYGRTFASAMKYSDDSFATFYKNLQDKNFFDNGYLIVFSDHRKIAPLTKEEFQHFGRSAYNRGVATIIGPGIEPNTFNNIPYQHIDFYHGLKLLITQGSLTIPSIANDPFGTYTGRDWSVRYCQYQDPRYYITETDGATAVWTDSYNSSAKRYISAYEKRHNQLSSNAHITIPTVLKNYGITLVAHQGSPVKHPANSVAAMRQAAQDGARGVEFDVSRTTDGYHVVVHGPDMGSIQCKNIKKPYIYQYSFKELRADCTLSNGDAILTLAEMLEKIEGLFDYVFVDIKNYESQKAEAQSKDIVQILSQFDRKDKIHPVAYNKTIANYLLSNSDKISVGWDSYDFDLPDLQQSNIVSYLLGIDFLKEDYYITIQNSTIPIFAYTVRSYEQMEKVLDSGITNILVSNINDALSYIKTYYKSR